MNGKIQVKDGVSLDGLHPDMLAVLSVVCSLYERFGEPFTVTSTTEGPHLVGSRHFDGLAFDVRTRDLRSHSPNTMAHAIRTRLGLFSPIVEVDVVVERTHIHVEIQSRQKELYSYEALRSISASHEAPVLEVCVPKSLSE